MLYRTHHRFSFPFNPFTSFSPSTTTTTTTPLSLHLLSSPSNQAEQGMECVEGALKSSLMPEMAAKAAQQAFFDDLWVNGQNGVAGDDFFVDDLLDFSKGGIEDGFTGDEEEEHGQDDKASCAPVLPPKQDHKAEKINFSVKDDFGSVPCSELTVPADDLADLEWLSHFVEDSFSEYTLTFPVGELPEMSTGNRSEKEIPVSANPCFTTPVQTKARTKRARTGGRVWSLGSPSLTETSSSSSTSSSSTTSLSSPLNPWLVYISPSQTAESFYGKSPAKKHKRKPATEASAGGGGGGVAHPPRRCSHCLVQKTPQWRTGPLGAKTLCNACGVRYKSGRLLPEYRPACSPTFSSDVHSNNHRKVLEMRRKKEATSDLASPVQSF